MLMLYSSLMCSCKPSFKKRCNSMDKFEVLGGGIMSISSLGNIRVSRPSIAPYPASRFNVFLEKRFNAVPGNIVNNACSYPPKSFFSFVFNSNNHYGFPFSPTPDRTAFPLSSDICFVNLHKPGEPFPVVKHHRPPKLMQNAPDCLITSNSKNSLKSFGTASVLLSNQPPCRSEPYLERNPRILINGTGLDRCLAMARLAHEKTTLRLPTVFSAALRTFKAFWPPYASKILGTSRFSAKFPFKFQYRFRVVFHSDTLPLVLL